MNRKPSLGHSSRLTRRWRKPLHQLICIYLAVCMLFTALISPLTASAVVYESSATLSAQEAARRPIEESINTRKPAKHTSAPATTSSRPATVVVLLIVMRVLSNILLSIISLGCDPNKLEIAFVEQDSILFHVRSTQMKHTHFIF